MIDKIKNFYFKYQKYILILMLAIFLILPQLIKSKYVMGLIVRILFYIVLSSSLNLINGYSGQFNIGHAGFVLIGSYTEAILATRFGMNFWLLLPISGLVTALAGFLVSLPTLRLRGIYLAIVTLGFSEIIRLVALNWTAVTGGPLGVKGIPSVQFFGLKTSSPHVYYYIALLVVALCLFTSYRVIHSKIGRAWMSIREDELAARSLGVESRRYKSINFMIGAFWAGVGGALMAPYYRFISSDMFIVDEGFNILSMVILGGQGTLIGPIIGSVMVNVITELFRFASEYRMVVYAVLIIAMMWWRPQGLAGASNSIMAGNRIRKPAKKKKKAV